MNLAAARAGIAPDWRDIIDDALALPALRGMEDFLTAEEKSGATVYPPAPDIFAAFRETPFAGIRVVILGQDPYHGAGQAHGLSFSVRRGVAIPKSLRNIYKELESEYGQKMPAHGDLTNWARQGVLLLNATLTVRQAAAGSHQNKGWEDFTDAVIRAVNDRHDHVVFMLWGAYAQKKGAFIDRRRHCVLEAPHPSPLSAHRGFLGCGHFKKADAYLAQHGRGAVQWMAEEQD